MGVGREKERLGNVERAASEAVKKRDSHRSFFI